MTLGLAPVSSWFLSRVEKMEDRFGHLLCDWLDLCVLEAARVLTVSGATRPISSYSVVVHVCFATPRFLYLSVNLRSQYKHAIRARLEVRRWQRLSLARARSRN